MAAAIVAAIDQHIADAGGAHFAEGDFVRTACFDNSQNRRPPAWTGGLSLASFFIENKRRDVFDHYEARQVNDRTDGQEDECDPNEQRHRLPRLS